MHPSRVIKHHASVEISIHEGRKHIVKRMFEELGYRVTRLRRIAIGNVELGNLEIGKTRILLPDERKKLIRD